MAEWIVEGTDRDGRTPRRETVEAPSAEAAQAEAYKRGVVPTSVRRVKDPAPNESTPAAESSEQEPFFRRLGLAWTNPTPERCWIVKGAMRDTATPVEMRFDGADPTHAERHAIDAGMLVREVCQAPPGWTAQGAMLIEKTSKKLKGGMLVSALICLAGVYGVFTADGREILPAPAGAIAMFGGALWFAAFKVAAWWHHG